MTTATMEPKTGKAKAISLKLASLRESLNSISPALAGPALIPVLKSVKIESKEGSTSFSATNLELAIRATVTHDGGEAATFLIPSERFLSYVKLLEGEDLTLTPGDTRVTLKCGRAVTKFPALSAATFPATSFLSGDDVVTLTQADALALTRHTLFAASDEESRHTLRGGLLEVSTGRVSLVTTDGHRLAKYTIETQTPELPSVLLPLDFMSTLGKVVADDHESTVTIGSQAEWIYCAAKGGESGSVDVTHKRLVGQFPNYKAIMPTGEPAVRIEVNVGDMLASLTRCVAMSDKKSLAVKLSFAPDRITMKAVDAEAGETEETVEIVAVTPFAPFSTGFKGSYLVDPLRRISGVCVLEFAKADSQTPMKLSHVTEDGGEFVYVVMPMRV